LLLFRSDVVLRPDRADTKDRTRAYRQKPKARSFTPAPVAADPRYLDVFVPLDVRKTLPVETEPRANFYVSDTWTSQTVVSVYALQSQKPAIPGTQVSKAPRRRRSVAIVRGDRRRDTGDGKRDRYVYGLQGRQTKPCYISEFRTIKSITLTSVGLCQAT
jgi:hypothetical protein